LINNKDLLLFSEVTGRFDILVRVHATDLEELHSVVIDKIGKIEGILNTETFVELQRTVKDPYYLSNKKTS